MLSPIILSHTIRGITSITSAIAEKPHAPSGLSISINWSPFARCYEWGATSECRLKTAIFVPKRPVCPEISGRRVRPTKHSSQTRCLAIAERKRCRVC